MVNERLPQQILNILRPSRMIEQVTEGVTAHNALLTEGDREKVQVVIAEHAGHVRQLHDQLHDTDVVRATVNHIARQPECVRGRVIAHFFQ